MFPSVLFDQMTAQRSNWLLYRDFTVKTPPIEAARSMNGNF